MDRNHPRKNTFELSQAIQSYLSRLANLAEYPVAYEQGDNLSALLKAMDFHIDLSDMPACEALYEQMALLNSAAKHQLFVLIHAKAYFLPDELEKLCQMAHYRKIPLLLLESHAYPPLPGEDMRIFDNDLCELHLDQSADIL